jgi:hypothetical protein
MQTKTRVMINQQKHQVSKHVTVYQMSVLRERKIILKVESRIQHQQALHRQDPVKKITELIVSTFLNTESKNKKVLLYKGALNATLKEKMV